MAIKIPPTFKLADLKALAFKCGISTSGTKPILTHRLRDEITSVARHPSPRDTRILSIDMGIRNLAYCIIDVSSKRSTSLFASSTKSSIGAQIPTVQSWHRLSVSSPPSSAEPSGPAVKESFSPSTLSTAAYSLLRHTLLPQNPTHILIERQRFRSMGSKHILEWTIRVNMFESILYAVLCTLKEEGFWGGEVVSVLPGKVGPFFAGVDKLVGGKVIGERDVHTKERNSKSSKILNKGLKIDLVKRWLEAGDVVSLGTEAIQMAQRYRDKWDRTPGGRKSAKKEETEEDEVGKLDDLADCLLQGMAWIQWEENKRLALKYGVEAFLDQ